jgi:Glycosyl transferase family 2
VSETVTHARRLMLGEPLPLRIGYTGPRSREFLDGAVTAIAADPGAVEALDALVLEPDAPGLDSVADAARAAGTPVVALGADSWAPPLDPSSFNPTGFRDAGVAGLAAVITRTGGGFEPGFELIATAAHGEPVTVLAPEGAELPPLPAGARRAGLGPRIDAGHVVRRAQEHLGVLDHPAFHASEFERAGWIAKLCAAGVPVCAEEISESLAELLGEELTALLRPLRARDLADLDLRERASVALRRAALREHSAVARWRQIAAALGIEVPGRPMVSVILSTRRESWLEHGIAQVARQNYEPRELVVCLHGDEFAAGTSERVRSLYPGECQVIRVDGELTLGDALNAGVETANGELVTKMDDDDYYSTEHLWDLVLALEYSGADLVGKGAEFVYLQWIDLTMRRFMGDSESDHPRLAGGAMMARKAPLQEIGGWPSRSRGEDTWIVRNFKKAGRGTYRTHGFGYILNRHGQGHTWNTYVDYFLIQSQREWRGLRFDETAIEP